MDSQVDAVLIPVPQMRSLTYREIEQISQSHVVIKLRKARIWSCNEASESNTLITT